MSWILSNTCFYLNYLKRFEFVVDTRFQETLIDQLNGILPILFAHDSRTQEMAELLGVPYFDVCRVVTLDLRSLYDDVDFKSLEVKYPYLYKNYIDFLEENGLAHTLRTPIYAAA